MTDARGAVPFAGIPSEFPADPAPEPIFHLVQGFQKCPAVPAPRAWDTGTVCLSHCSTAI